MMIAVGRRGLRTAREYIWNFEMMASMRRLTREKITGIPNIQLTSPNFWLGIGSNLASQLLNVVLIR